MPMLTVHRLRKLQLFVLGAVISISPGAHAQCQFGTLVASEAASNDFFGEDVDVSGTWLAVGSQLSDGPVFTNQGAVYVYQLSGQNWFLSQVLVAADTDGPDNFGSSVAFADDQLLVGASFADATTSSGSGAVYVYALRGESWTQIQRLEPNDPMLLQFFGGQLAFSDDRLFVSAGGDDGAAPNAGAAYVFENSIGGWIEKQKLTASDASDGDGFGVVAVDAQLLVIGASLDEDLVDQGGAAYVFEFDGTSWVETAKLIPHDLDAGDRFGNSIAVAGRTILVGALQDSELGSGAGAVYVFEEVSGSWTETQKILPSDGASFFEFGSSISASGSTAVIGSRGAQGPVSGSGAAYLFQKQSSTWIETGKFVTENGHLGDDIGSSVKLDGDVVVLGSTLADTAVIDAGAAFTFSLSGALCPTLRRSPPAVSLALGGTVRLTMNPGPSFGGAFYWLVGSLNGISPGFPLFGLQMPINPDEYFGYTLVEFPGSPLVGNMGTFPVQGRAVAQLIVPAGTDPALVGLTVHHAFAAYKLGPLSILHVSNPVGVPLEL